MGRERRWCNFSLFIGFSPGVVVDIFTEKRKREDRC